MRLLAFDISSTSIGMVELTDGQVTRRHTEKIAVKTSPIGYRCWHAYLFFQVALRDYAPDAVAYEGPNKGGHINATIQMQRVVGQLLSLAWDHRLLIVEVSPSSAKKVLTGSGNADKARMIAAAAAQFGYAWTEHEADALGVAIAAQIDLRGRELCQQSEQAA